MAILDTAYLMTSKFYKSLSNNKEMFLTTNLTIITINQKIELIVRLLDDFYDSVIKA